MKPRHLYKIAAMLILLSLSLAGLSAPVAPALAQTSTCQVTYAPNQWNTGFTADVKITNNTAAAIQGWTLTWTFANGQQITGSWNATVTQNGATVTASNPASHWNGTIVAGGSVSFGFQATHSGTNAAPADFTLNGTACNGGNVTPTYTPTRTNTSTTPTNTPTRTNTGTTPTYTPTRTNTSTTPTYTPTRTNTNTNTTPTNTPTGYVSVCQVVYTLSQWSNGFTADVKITNNAAAAIQGWTLTWTFANGQQITGSWNATVTQNGATVTASSPASHWNGTIAAGGSASFGFQATHSGTNAAPADFTLNGTACNTGNVTPTNTPTRTNTSTTPTNTPTRTNTGTTPTNTPTRTNTPTITPTGSSNVLYVGRFNTSDSTGPKSAWSATTIKANFTGTGISANVNSTGDNWYNVVIDGVALTPVNLPAGTNGVVTLASGLASGTHTIEFVRRTEAWVGDVQFRGFTVTGGQLLTPPTPSARRIEFIGDSITAGYGNEGANQYQSCTTKNENAYLAYGSVAARALGADQFTIAWSGKGVIRNYGGDTTDVLPSIYLRILPYDTTTLWNPSQWIPQVVVINLGTNDFSTGAPDKTTFTTAYANFAAQIRSQYPQAHIYCALGPMLSGSNLDSARDYITTVVNQLTAAGDTKVHFIEFPMQDGSLGYGEDWHPSVAEHAAMAAQLTSQLKTDLGW